MGTISVAMATCNGARHVRGQLESCLAQSRLPDEVIVSDDRSADGTVQLARDVLENAGIPHRITVNSERLGVQLNFEQAIRQASGEIIVLSDQDDIWLPHKLQTVEERLSADSAGGVFSDAITIHGDAGREGPRLWDVVGFTEARTTFAREPLSVLLKRHVVTGATLAFRAELRDALLPLSRAALHDKWIGLVLASLGKLEAVEEPLIYYRVHQHNAVGLPSRSVVRNARARFGRRGHAAAELELFLDLRERLMSLGLDQTVMRIEPKIDHLRHRSQLPKAPLRRGAKVAVALARRDYSRFSSSAVRAAVFDLLGGERGSVQGP